MTSPHASAPSAAAAPAADRPSDRAFNPPVAPAALAAEICIGLLVPPVLLGGLAARLLVDVLGELGLLSEQVFAGERLPHLNVAAPAENGEAAGAR